ncbi:1,4-alpha-glucan branching enzyme [Blautia massiliensis (ex Durand et al. 2017)]|uniref:1,4-alpha-glucan branching enzyme n=1 Tax=Blautia massiliensis (ex Durand et al. 2017) TaxID=1737424 RepID=UPI0015703852|nr:1,4-alpha-glucan branching enzyme [Blautia massiliensis (ex Durand et al. 2017)]NSK77299.1 1,4-alpha-glucan branching enzyme [Blautia massiliensis (ex Durand et al. 2017)]
MADKAYEYMDWPRIEAIVYGEEASPRDVMQPRVTEDGVLIQGFFPGADAAEVVVGEKSYPMILEDEAGYYAVMLPLKRIPEYRFRVIRGSRKETFYDAYECPCQITEEEERAFCAGVYYKAYEKLGAHPGTCGEVEGTYFAVWAPNAIRVSVVGDFDRWDGRRLPMHRMPMSGIFEIFVPGVQAGASYQYEIKIKGGNVQRKSDPYGNGTQGAPSVISVVTELGDFLWQDEAWMKERERFASREVPVSIYETDVTEWKNSGELVEFLKETGYTHVEFHPVMEYLDRSSGGYSTSAYYAVTTRFGTAADFRTLVEDLHQAGIGVILDWTPAQFPRFDAGLEKFDGTPLYEVQDPAMAVHPMWGTMLYNYGSPMVKDFLISNAFFWLDEFHVDGFRMDDVDAMLYLDFGREAGQWTANLYSSNENLQALEFLKHLNSIVKKQYPGILLIAQEDGLWPQLTDSVENDHLGFDYKWSGGWTKDLLSYLEAEPLDRRNYYDQLTLSMMYAYSEHYVLTLGKRDVGTLKEFLEKLPGSSRQKDAQLRAAYGYLMLHPGVKMTAPDGDVGPEMRAYLHDLNELYRNHPALYAMDGNSDGFEWIQFTSYDENVVAFLRKTEKQEETILAVCNFSPVSYDSYRVGVPFAGKYKEIFNSDSEKFGGQGVVNARAKAAIHMECDNREFSLKLKLPAYGVAVFGCTPEKVDVKKSSVKKGNVKKTVGKSRGKRMDKAKMKVVEKSVAVKDAVKVVKRVASRRKGASGDE